MLTFKPYDARGFGAEATGIDLSKGIDAAQTEQIDDALARYGVVCFRNQPLNDDQQQAFIEKFGPPTRAVVKEIARGHPHFYDISTVDENGNPYPEDSVFAMYMRANLLWHTDGTPNQPPFRLTALSARTLPPNPPPTEFADMRAAWNALSKEEQAELDGLMVEHSIFASRAKMGMSIDDFSEETKRLKPPVQHPLVRTHKRTGLKSLYLASHASHIIGWPKEKGEALLARLTEHATQPQFVHVHHWQPDDLLMWDDSWTMHRATPYNRPEPRILRWSAVCELEPV
jgi:alpha-ketoglutarate-dependent 2,4-dichlorophenoxyacetate dioxygenase